MPIYEYKCESCEDVFEVLQKISEPAPQKCKKCGNEKIKRLMSQSSFVLKGSGWYATDYAEKKREQE